MSWVTKKMTEEWGKEWKGMPEFIQEDKTPFRILQILFEKGEDVETFLTLIGQTVTPRTKWLWFPKKEKKHLNKEYVDEP